MNPFYIFRRRFRMHKSFSRNPRKSMLTDIAGTVFLIGFVAMSAWLSLSVITDNDPALQVSTATPSNALVQGNLAPETNGVTNGVVAKNTVANTSANGSQTVESADKPGYPTNEDNIYESNWIFQLPDEKYVVQFGSSTNREQLYEDAKLFPVSPVAFYPFRVTQSERVIYGYAAGVYASLDEANLAIAALPPALVQREPWIRPVGELKKQIMAVSN